jgi:hypothetical protein
MPLFTMSIRNVVLLLLGAVVGHGLPASARCLESPSYAGSVRVLACEEAGPAAIFIQAELTEVSALNRKIPETLTTPKKGDKLLVFISQPPLIRGPSGNLQPRKPSHCKGYARNTTITGTLIRPCCDANYAFCQRPVDFIMASKG